jgi:hypothetical protein
VQLLVAGHEHFSEPAPGMRPQHPEAQPRGGRRAGRVVGGQVRIGLGLPGDRDQGQAGLQVGVGDLLQVLAQRAEGAERRQTLVGVAAVVEDVPVDHRLHQGVLLGGQVTVLDQDLSQRLVLGEHPGVHRRQEGVAAHEVHLQGQDAEEQIAVGGCRGRRGFGHGGASSLGSGR